MINADITTPTLFKAVFSFPNPVNEIAARLVATMVLTLALATIIAGQWWLMPILAYGFLARVMTGPTLSPMGLLATRVFVPWMGDRGRLVPGPPKRFAQSVGVVFSFTALALYFVTDGITASRIVLGVLSVFAALEAGLGFCAGCMVFNYAMRWGLIPESMCEECRVDYELLAA